MLLTRSKQTCLSLLCFVAIVACDGKDPAASAAATSPVAQTPAPGGIEAPSDVYEFGSVPQGGAVEHEFELRNDGTADLRIAGVRLSPPLQLAKMPAVIAPGTSGKLKLTLDTRKVEGDYEGQLVVMLDGGAQPRVFALKGAVVAGIEVLPLPAFFISTSKGEAKTETREIVSHEKDPLSLTIKSAPEPGYSATLEPLEEGRRYRLNVTVPADAPAGKRSTRLELASSSAATPVVYVGVNTLVRERVYTFPDAVDFGAIPLEHVRDGSAATTGASQTLMVYQTDGKDFSVEASTDVPGLALTVEPAASGDRAQITATLREDVAAGDLRGSIVVRTNDSEFPELRIPVSGAVGKG